MVAEPLPSTLIEFSSAVGVKPEMTISLAPGCRRFRQSLLLGKRERTYLQTDVPQVSDHLRPCRVKRHAACWQIAERELLLMGICFRHDDNSS